MKYLTGIVLGAIFIASPLIVNAQTTTSTDYKAQLIAVLTQLVQTLENEIQQILTQQSQLATQIASTTQQQQVITQQQTQVIQQQTQLFGSAQPVQQAQPVQTPPVQVPAPCVPVMAVSTGTLPINDPDGRDGDEFFGISDTTCGAMKMTWKVVDPNGNEIPSGIQTIYPNDLENVGDSTTTPLTLIISIAGTTQTFSL